MEYSKEMVKLTKQKLKIAGYSKDLVICGNMEEVDKNWGSYDCLTAMGSVYYARDFSKTMKDLTSILTPRGNFIFSLRNQLFSLFSMNQYTINFLIKELIPFSSLSNECQNKLFDFFMDKFTTKELKKKFKKIDDFNVHSIYHNPLTIKKEISSQYGLELVDIYFFLLYLFSILGVVMLANLFGRENDNFAFIGMFLSFIVIIVLGAFNLLIGLYPLLILVPVLITFLVPSRK